MRIWNNAILFFLEFSKTYIPFASHTYRFIQKKGRGETISRLLSFYRQNNDDTIFFCFHVNTTNLYDALKRDATSIGINISKDSNSW